VAAGRVTLCFALGLCLVACSDDGDDGASPTTAEASSSSTTSTAPERPASTTTTAFDPASVEGQVEAAYLKSWDVYADAVYDLELDEAALAEVYSGTSLKNLRTEISDRIAGRKASLAQVEHDYDITITSPTTALVVDAYRNHQVRIDADTKAPVERDPDSTLVYAFNMRLIDSAWRVAEIQKVGS
jgi:hypothetical protein